MSLSLYLLLLNCCYALHRLHGIYTCMQTAVQLLRMYNIGWRIFEIDKGKQSQEFSVQVRSTSEIVGSFLAAVL
jgi:hypothetical protein